MDKKYIILLVGFMASSLVALFIWLALRSFLSLSDAKIFILVISVWLMFSTSSIIGLSIIGKKFSTLGDPLRKKIFPELLLAGFFSPIFVWVARSDLQKFKPKK